MNIDLDQLEFVHPTMRKLAAWLQDVTGLTFTITSIYRTTGTGVHTTLPVRGLDLSCRLESLGKLIAAEVNSNWAYDPDRPEMECCIFHDVGQGPHLHLQVHPSTTRRQ